MSNDLNKPQEKFLMDMIYEIGKSGSCLISEISRALDEKIKLNYTIKRLCDNLVKLLEEEINIIKENYYNEIKICFQKNQ